MISNQLLAKIAVYTAAVGTSGCIYLFLNMQKKLRQSPYIVESMRLIRENKGAVEYLGKPVKFGYFNLGSEHNFCDGYKAQFEMPVKGSHNNGNIYLWARREHPEQEWDVYRLEFSPSSDTSKRLIIKQEE